MTGWLRAAALATVCGAVAWAAFGARAPEGGRGAAARVLAPSGGPASPTPVEMPDRWILNAIGSVRDGRARDMPPLTVLAQIDLNGQIDGCRCRQRTLGSIANQAGTLDRLIEGTSAVRAVVLYAGDLFAPPAGDRVAAHSPWAAWQDLRRRTIEEFVVGIDEAIVAPGPSDWTDVDAVSHLARRLPGRVVCSNRRGALPPGVVAESRVNVGAAISVVVRCFVLPRPG